MSSNPLLSWIEKLPPEEWARRLGMDSVTDVRVIGIVSRPYSWVARCRISGPQEVRTIYVKQAKNPENISAEELAIHSRKEFDAAQKWYRLFSRSDSFHVVKPLFYVPGEAISVTEESTGTSFYQIVEEGARRFNPRYDRAALQKAAEQIGRWVAYKNSITGLEKEQYQLNNLLNYLRVRFDILLDDPRRIFEPELPGRINAYIKERWPSLPEGQLKVSLSHSDFNPGNILVEGDHVIVLDFGKLNHDSYLLDVVKLYHALILWTFKPQFSRKNIGEIQKSLLHGFGESGIRTSPMFSFLLIRNIITHLTNMSRLRGGSLPGRVYNRWVMNREIRILKSMIGHED